MPRKGTATVKTPNREDRYMIIDSDSDEVTSNGEKLDSSASPPDVKISTAERQEHGGIPGEVLEAASRQVTVREPLRQPRQASPAVRQSATLASSLFPPDHADEKKKTTSSFDLPLSPPRNPPASRPYIQQQQQSAYQEPLPREQSSPTARLQAPGENHAPAQSVAATRSKEKKTKAADSTARVKKPRKNHTSPGPNDASTADMASGGSYIPPNQQRNMRACMVCSIVRTSQQFLQQGCPNCEYILELIGNPDQINDCTSQVFEGLITVADTQRSWVARYQRLEGYVPGVYATQVEGILPEDVIGAIENAGINYVPRDGSEQEMLPKD